MKGDSHVAAGQYHWMAAVRKQEEEVMTGAAGESGLWTTASLAAKHPSLCPPCRAWLAGHLLPSTYLVCEGAGGGGRPWMETISH